MAGKAGRSGGSRKGAGRKPFPPEKLNTPTPIPVTEVAPTMEQLIGERIAKSLIEPKQDRYIAQTEKTIEAMQTCDMRNLVCPIEFENMPFAKRAWEYVLELNENSRYKLINSRHYESLKGYCLAVELRQSLISEWERQGKPTTILSRNGELKVNPIVTEISRQNDKINDYADALGLTVMSEFRMAKESQSSPTLHGKTAVKEDNLFD